MESYARDHLLRGAERCTHRSLHHQITPPSFPGTRGQIPVVQCFLESLQPGIFSLLLAAGHTDFVMASPGWILFNAIKTGHQQNNQHSELATRSRLVFDDVLSGKTTGIRIDERLRAE